MKTAVLSVGTEILFGQITDTNTVFLSQQLHLLGFDVMYHFTVGDNSERLGEMINMVLKDCDLIITTGGLGPTEDDLTKETVCDVLHDHLVENSEIKSKLYGFADRCGHTMTGNNLKQAMMPSRSIVFDNNQGTAPGFALSENGKTIICMPGPPREMTQMWTQSVRPFLIKMQNAVIYYKTLHLFGIGESTVETKLIDLVDSQTDPTIATYAKEAECTVRIASKRSTSAEAETAVNEMIKLVREKVGEYIFSYDDESLPEVVGRKLIDRNITVSACESCTGGMFSSALTDIPGISAVFDRGLVTYTYNAKMNELGVKNETLAEYTAESSQVALEMVQGLRAKTNSRLCISVTGIAGPGGGTPEKPVGTVYIGCIFDERTEVSEIRIRNVNRNWNRHYAVMSMFDIINRMIEGRSLN